MLEVRKVHFQSRNYQTSQRRRLSFLHRHPLSHPTAALLFPKHSPSILSFLMARSPFFPTAISWKFQEGTHGAHGSGDDTQLKFWPTAVSSNTNSLQKMSLKSFPKAHLLGAHLKWALLQLLDLNSVLRLEMSLTNTQGQKPQTLQSELGSSLSPSWEEPEALPAFNNDHMQVLHHQPGENQNPTPKPCITGNIAKSVKEEDVWQELPGSWGALLRAPEELNLISHLLQISKMMF